MGALVTYLVEDSIASITMDDGKVNVMSWQMLAEINTALDRAASDRAVVVLTGRDDVFSAGFDLAVLGAGGSESTQMVRAGFETAARMLSFPMPIMIACTGHAVAMGVFLLLAGDYRVGAAGPYKLTANEVAIGLTMPRAAVEILRQRLSPAHFNRAVTLAEAFSPDNAVEAGLLDRVVPKPDLSSIARSIAVSMSGLDMAAHAASKLRAREHTLNAIKSAIAADLEDFRRPAMSGT